MRSLKNRARRAERLALVLCGALAMALLIGFHAVAQNGLKGSSCAHPYKVHWNPGEGPSSMTGDTRFIRARHKFRIVSRKPLRATITVSVAPRVRGLRLCGFEVLVIAVKVLPDGTRKEAGVVVRRIWHRWHAKSFVMRPRGQDWTVKTVRATAARA